MTSFVLDASVALAATLPGEAAVEIASAIVSRIPVDGAWVPGLWLVEVGNAVLRRLRRGLLHEGAAKELLDRLYAIPITIDDYTPHSALWMAFRYSAQYGLTLYDGCYLELALRRGLPLATFDNALRRAAEAARVPLANPPA